MSIDYALISEEQADEFRRLTSLHPDVARGFKHELWRQIRQEHGLPPHLKYAVTTDFGSERYRVIREKQSGEPVGKARSGMPYRGVPISNLLPYLASQYIDIPVQNLPVGARVVGGGLFEQGGFLFFPAI